LQKKQKKRVTIFAEKKAKICATCANAPTHIKKAQRQANTYAQLKKLRISTPCRYADRFIVSAPKKNGQRFRKGAMRMAKTRMASAHCTFAGKRFKKQGFCHDFCRKKSKNTRQKPGKLVAC